MEHTSHASRLRYLDADDVDDSVIDYDGLDVKGPDGQSLGNVDGFIVDRDARRAYYVVVDSGGWFSSRQFLVPVGHARLDTEDRSLRVDVARDTLSEYPEFDHNRFNEFTDDELRDFETRMGAACCPDEVSDVSVPNYTYGTRRHYAEPEWWPRTGAREHLPGTRTQTTAAPPVRDSYNEERVTARAQPGDVLGLEPGATRTHLGETAEDEAKRLQKRNKREER